MLTPHVMFTPHLYTWPRLRGVFVGYIEILRYTSDLPPGGLESSFLSEARLQSCLRLVFSLILLSPLSVMLPLFFLYSCLFSLALFLDIVFTQYISEDSSICLYIPLACIVV